MAETLVVAEIEFLGEDRAQQYLGKIVPETRIFEIYEEGKITASGFIPFSAIKKLRVIGEKSLETPYDVSVMTGSPKTDFDFKP